MLLAPIWVMWAVLHYAPRLSFSRAARVGCAVVYPLLVIFAASANLHHLNTDYYLGIATTVFVWVLLSSGRAENPQGVYSRVARRLASFSFTVYLTHRPLITLVGCFVMGRELWQPDAKHLALGTGLLILLAACAWGIASVTEFRTNEMRVWVERLGLRKSAGRQSERLKCLEGRDGGSRGRAG